MSNEIPKINVEVKRLHLTKWEADPETGEVFKNRAPLEILEWTEETGLKVLYRRDANASDDRRA